MQESDDGNFPRQSTAAANSARSFPGKSRMAVTPTKSLVRFQEQRVGICSDRKDPPTVFQETFSSASRTEPRIPKYKPPPNVSDRGGKLCDAPKLVANDCRKATGCEVPAELAEPHKEKKGEDRGGRPKRRKPEEDGTGGAPDALSYTKEFHVLSEVQKARILTAIEDAIKKLANADYKDFCQQEEQSRCHDNASFHAENVNIEKFFCKKFLLPWVLMKVIEMIVCHLIQLTFLSNDSYFQRKNEFLPVVFTYYLTLFIIIFSLMMHIICFSYPGVQHPCYFMGLVSSSILALTTALGILIMLCSMDYHRTFREILVLVFVGALLCSLVVELCICYAEVKSFWKRMQNADYSLS